MTSRIDALMAKLARSQQPQQQGYDPFPPSNPGFGAPSQSGFGYTDPFADPFAYNGVDGVDGFGPGGFGGGFGAEFQPFGGQFGSDSGPTFAPSESEAFKPSFAPSESDRSYQVPSSPGVRFEDYLTPHEYPLPAFSVHSVQSERAFPPAQGEHQQNDERQSEHEAAFDEPAFPAFPTDESKPDKRPPREETDASDDFGDVDDSWLLSAADEAIKVEESQPQRLSHSPHFPKPEAAEAFRPSTHLKPASRPTSTSDVKFPKPATPKICITPQPQYSPQPRPLTPSTRKAQPAQAASTLREPTLNNKDLVPVMAIECPRERSIFSEFTHFNAMQSAIFRAAYGGDENLVVTAPTGSGKTTVFELAYLRMRQDNYSNQNPFAIYIAPTKALVNERFRDWKYRMQGLDGFQCLELTGDSESGVDSRKMANATLIVTTPEKWDSLTRKIKLDLTRLKLIMIDEVHILREDRGPTLEVIVARMKRKAHAARFVAVSASVPNMEDVARWIGRNEFADGGTSDVPVEAGGNTKEASGDYDDLEKLPQATVFKFSDEFRSVPLTKKVLGFEAFNDFALGPKLDKQLFSILNAHSSGKPVLIFCPTRKACSATASQIFADYEAASKSRKQLPWSPSKNQKLVLKDLKVQEFTTNGIAVHHAGLDYSDRRSIEDAFKSGTLHCLISTSTLAVGINLPAYLVVIKGTTMWQGSGFRDYSDVDIQQMMGRAGRPQFSHEGGKVVIMCNERKKDYFENVVSSRMTLESCLHQHLTEHINSEIGLGTIRDLETGKRWLNGTFLAIRLRQNPRHYVSALVKDHAKTWKETLDRYMENAIDDLKENGLVGSEWLDDGKEELGGPAPDLNATQIGKIMSQNFISYATMRHIIAMKEDASVQDLLCILAGSTEFNALRIRQGEGKALNALRDHPGIRYKLEEAVKTYADKVFLHMQITFGCVQLEATTTKTEHSSPIQTQMAIFQAAPRIAKAILMVAFEKKYGIAARSALELLHTINGKAWEDSSSIFRQIHTIGPKSLGYLESQQITTFEAFTRLEPNRLELWLKRNHPYGQNVIDWASTFPRFKLDFRDASTQVSEDGKGLTLTVEVVVSWTGCVKELEKRLFGEIGRRAKGSWDSLQGKPYSLTILFISSKNRFLDVRRISCAVLLKAMKNRTMDVEFTLEDPEETVQAIIGVDELAGVSNTFEYKPDIDPSLFPEKPAVVDMVDELIDVDEPSTATKSKAEGKKPAAEPLFLPKDVDSDSDNDMDDMVEITGSEFDKLKAAPSKPKKKKRGDRGTPEPAPLKQKRMKVSAFIDDEAIESGDDGDGDDDMHSLGSFGEFEQFFDDSTPPPPTKFKQTEYERELSASPFDISSQDDPMVLPSPPPTAAKASLLKPHRPSTKADPTPRARYAATPPPTAAAASASGAQWHSNPTPRARYALTPPSTAPSASGVQFNSPTGTLRNALYKHTPSAEKATNGNLFKPLVPFALLDDFTSFDDFSALDDSTFERTLAPDVSSTRSAGPIFPKAPLPVAFHADVSMNKHTEPGTPPPSGQPDDFDEWMNDLLHQ